MVVGAPAHPHRIIGDMVIDERLKRACRYREQGGLVDFFLGNANQLFAKWREYRSCQWPQQMLKPLKHHATFGGPAGADFNDFHVFGGDAAVV